MSTAARSVPRTVGLEPHFAALLPEVLIGLGPDQFAALAARALAPKEPPSVSITHLHAPQVDVREQATIIVDRLRRSGAATFRALVGDCETTLLIVGRFLALLELFREGVVSFEQVTPLGDLTVRWTGGETTEVDIGEDQYGPAQDADGALAMAETVGQPRDDDSDQGRGTDDE